MVEKALKIQPSPAPSVTVAAYDPALHQQFHSFLEEERARRLQVFALVLTNNSGHAIHGLTVRWTMVTADGREHVMDYASDSFIYGGTVVDNDDSLLVTPSTMLTASLLKGGFGYIGPGIDTSYADRFNGAIERRVSLDTVVFDNGEVFGPDLSETVKSIDGRTMAIRTVIKAYYSGELGKLAERPIDRSDKVGMLVFRLPQQNLWGDSGSGSRPKL